MHVSAPRLFRHSTLPAVKSDYPEDLPHKSILQDRSHNLPLPVRATTSVVSPREGWSGGMSPLAQLRHRSIWENDLTEDLENQRFEPGLTGAGNAPASKGYRAQAPFPPVFPSLSFGAPTSYERYSDPEPLEEDTGSDLGLHYGNGSEWSYDEDMDMDAHDDYGSTHYLSKGVYQSPLLEDLSPVDRDDPVSSPGPMTPFGDFVDRAISLPCTTGACTPDLIPSHDTYQGPGCGPYCQECRHVESYELEPAPPAATPASAADKYKKLADPMSEWIASFVWKLCTGAIEVEAGVLRPSARQPAQSSVPAPHLAALIRSLLLSTLLQPSAILLAMRFIARLPIQLGPIHLDTDQVDEYRFRVALLGRPDSREREEKESLAPFRLVVLGFMLANKWLDDHTFSNKTWHTISNVPIGWLNNLEMLALDVFQWDLSINVEEWSSWLSQIASYHASLSSAPSPYPQPISRPSSTPHAIIRKAIEDIRQAVDTEPCTRGCCDIRLAQPIFLGLQERQDERDEIWDADVCDIDLDEDGPLREEYLPRRRSSKTGSSQGSRSRDGPSTRPHHDRVELERALPPPARWSPSADEPLPHGRDRRSAVVMAPPYSGGMPPAPPAPRLMPVDARYPAWQSAAYPPDPRYPPHAYNTAYHPPPRHAYGYETATHPHPYPYPMVASYGVSPPEPAWHRPEYQGYHGAFPQAAWPRIVAH